MSTGLGELSRNFDSLLLTTKQQFPAVFFPSHLPVLVDDEEWHLHLSANERSYVLVYVQAVVLYKDFFFLASLQQ